MTRNWKIAEKVIAGILIVWGILNIVATIWVIQHLIYTFIQHPNYSWEDVSILRISKNYHYQLIIAILTLISGFTLIIKKKIGWITSFTISIYHAITILTSIFRMKDDFTENKILFYFFTGTIFLIFVSMSRVLLTKQIRVQYSPTKKSWYIIIVLLTFLLLYHTLMQLYIRD